MAGRVCVAEAGWMEANAAEVGLETEDWAAEAVWRVVEAWAEGLAVVVRGVAAPDKSAGTSAAPTATCPLRVPEFFSAAGA